MAKNLTTVNSSVLYKYWVINVKFMLLSCAVSCCCCTFGSWVHGKFMVQILSKFSALFNLKFLQNFHSFG
ncbi:hypothetical protein ACFXTN_018439 [Malus domestica]